MLNGFEQLRKFIKPKGYTIDNFVCRLHYKMTVLILVVSCIFVTSSQLFGDPMNCITGEERKDSDKEARFEKVLNRYCWMRSTFSVVSAWKKSVGIEVPYPGIAKNQPGEDVIYHAYYKWVSSMLIVQAIFFYLPHFIWKRYEANFVKKLLIGLEGQTLDNNDRAIKISMMAEYLDKTTFYYGTQFWIYVFTEILNFANVVVQILWVNKFLGGKFLNYGMDVMGWTSWAQFPLQYNPMMQIFPRLTKCTFHQFGPSGDLDKYDTMCVLPINTVNEKIFLFLWFWFYILAAVTGLSILYRALHIFLPSLRVNRLKRICECRHGHVQRVLHYSGIGDWFLMCLLAKNMGKQDFRDLIEDLAAKQEKEKIP